MILIFSILALLGLSLGSFMGVCIERIPAGLSIVTLHSRCPSCQRALKLFELIPVVSYLRQKGRCSSCVSKISIQCPLLELLSASLAVLFFVLYGPTGKFLTVLTFAYLMLPITFIDWRHYLIPNEIVVLGYAVGILLFAFTSPNELLQRIIASLTSLLILFAVRQMGSSILGREAMGLGDVKLAGLIGLFVGMPKFFISLWIACFLGIVYALLRSYFRGTSLRGIKIPFGSLLGIASLLTLVFTDSINHMFGLWLT